MIEKFKHQFSVQLRFSDFDMLSHLNNAVYLTYIETARIQYFYDVLQWDFKQTSCVVVKAQLEYLLPILPHYKPIIHSRISRIGNKSFEMEYLLTDDSGTNIYSKCTSVQVCIDPKSEESIQIPDHLRKKMIAYENH